MAHYRSTKSYWAMMATLSLPWGFCGCAGFNALPVLGQSAKSPPTVEQRDQVELPPSNPNTTVTAVQDFLERTRAYDLEKVETTPKTVSATDVVFKPTSPIRNEPVAAPLYWG